MKKLLPFIPAVLFITVTFTSCQKEDLEESNAAANAALLKGNWKFLNLTAKTYVETEVGQGSDLIKSVTYSDYTTFNNAGNLTITDKDFSYADLEYAIDDTAFSRTYFDGDTIVYDYSFEEVLPKTSFTTQYKLVGADSIAITGGSLVSVDGPTASTPASGAKFKFEGNKLYLTSRMSQNIVQTVPGTPPATAKNKFSVEAVLTFQRQ